MRAHPGARILIVGQAPGARVHASGIPWDDASGKRLRAWLNVDDATFYDESLFAIVPMGFCYPGRGASGDNPPRPECAPLWLDKLLAELPDIRLTLLIGQYAQRRFLGARRKSTLTETVRAWPEYAPEFIPLPHPSPRNQGWLKQHPWFDADVLPALRDRVAELLPTPPGSRRTKRRHRKAPGSFGLRTASENGIAAGKPPAAKSLSGGAGGARIARRLRPSASRQAGSSGTVTLVPAGSSVSSVPGVGRSVASLSLDSTTSPSRCPASSR